MLLFEKFGVFLFILDSFMNQNVANFWENKNCDLPFVNGFLKFVG